MEVAMEVAAMVYRTTFLPSLLRIARSVSIARLRCRSAPPISLVGFDPRIVLVGSPS